MTAFKPMLASPVDLATLRLPKLASPKYDGIRATVIDGVALSRTLKPIPNKFVQHVIGRKKYNGLDGELIVGLPFEKDVYRNTVSGVMSIEGEPQFKFYVFDNWIMDRVFEDRLADVHQRVIDLEAAEGVHHLKIHDRVSLDTYEAGCVEVGYEGIMLRDPNGGYKFGRATPKEQTLLKMKRFVDSEAIVLGVVEEMQNTNEAQVNELGRTKRSTSKAGLVGKGTMGALDVMDIRTGVEFQIGSGFTAKERAEFFKNPPRLVKYKYFPVGVKDKPRHPIYLGTRAVTDIDLTKAMKQRIAA